MSTTEKTKKFSEDRFQYAIGHALEGCRELLVAEMTDCWMNEDQLSLEEAHECLNWLIYEVELS